MDLYDLADQTLAAYADHIVHIGVSHALCDNKRACYLLYRTFAHWKVSPTFLSFLIAAEQDI